MAFGIGGQAIARFSDRAALANAGQHILEGAPLGQVVEHIVGGDEWQPGRFTESGEAGETPRIIAAVEVVGGEKGTAGEIRRDPGRKVRRIRRLGRQGDDDLTVAVRDHIGVVEMAFPLRSAAFAKCQ